ncbi:MAG: TIGR02147 family protein [bacterium]
MNVVFTFTNYREYLKQYFEEQKKTCRRFSYQYFSDLAGFKNKSFIFRVVKGDKNLSRASIIKINQAIKHNQEESEYFENLVLFNQAKNVMESNYFYERLSSIKLRGKNGSEALMIRRDQFELYSKWHHLIIRSLIDMFEFRGDCAWLARNVNPRITEKQARDSVKLLEKLGLIEKQENGVYRVLDKSLDTGKEVLSNAVARFHLDMMQIASSALNKLDIKKRNISGMTLGISEKTYNMICNEIRMFQFKLAKLAEFDEEADRVYQLNFHLFPLSEPDINIGE